MSRDWEIIEHRFGGLATLGVQRFSTGSGARSFHFIKNVLSIRERQVLLDFYDAVQGSFQTFTYNAPNADRTTTTAYQVLFETKPLSITDLAGMCKTGITFIESIDPASAPTYSVSSVNLRFPSSTLATELLSQTQQLIPLIHIKCKDPAVPAIYLSDRRCTVGSHTYLPRLLELGEPGGDAILTQDIKGSADNIRFTFGNADRAMSLLSQDTSLKFAQIDLCFYHINSGILLQFWKGNILNWTRDGSSKFPVFCSDGLYPVEQQYPRRTVTRQCWKTFNDGVNCPWSTKGSGGNPTSCDYFFNSPNGCLSHGMSPYFGGHPSFPQSVTIKDNGTGILNFFRSTVTSTSIISDSIWGQALPEIWCNDNSDPRRAFMANTMVAAVRDESDFMDVLGIVGVGPIGRYEGMSVQTNADGYSFVVAPLADGFPPQGFQVDGNLHVTGFHPTMGIREVTGQDPAFIKRGVVNISGTTVSYVSGDDFTDLGQGSELYFGSSLGFLIVGVVSDSHHLTLVPKPSAGWTFFKLWTVWQTLIVSDLVGLFTSTSNGYGTLSNVSWSVATDPFSLGQGTPQHWDVPDQTYSNIMTGQANDILPFAAGTAFVELRYNKATTKGGLAPSTAESHTMVVPVARGLTGYTYDAGDAQSVVNGLINPFWIAVNTYLRALGLEHADSLVQIAAFVRESVFKGDGTGCAEIADLQVPPLVGDPSVLETQFQFQGTLAEFKPFRDWLTEILSCALGYYTFEFGRLKLGIRENASAVSAFTLGNMLFQSLSVSPTEAAFEYLKVYFANVALQYQQDFAEYEDKDHTTYFGRAGAPLTSQMRSVGLCEMSQALRVAATRVREEIGGILRPDQANPYIEFDNALTISFKTTVLALDTEVGQVISVTHPDIPTYPGPVGGVSPGANTWNFRITKWTLHKDWSVSIEARSVTDSMYDLDRGPKPGSVLPPPLPVLFFAEPLGHWAPGKVQANAADALFPSEYRFGVELSYPAEEDGSPRAQAIVSGKLPINQFIPSCGAPDAKRGTVVQSPTGGSINGNDTYFVQVCAVNALGQYSPPSDILVIQVPTGTNTNSFTLSGIKWPSVVGLTGYVVFASDTSTLICGQQTGALTGSLGSYTPTSITVTGPFARSTYAIPNALVDRVRVKERRLIHGGVLGAPVNTLSSTTITATDTVDLTSVDNWAGRALAVIGRSVGQVPFASFNITSFNPATGVFTVDRNPITGGVQAADIFVVCFKGYDNSTNPYLITDTGLSNASNGHAGETVNDPNRIGNYVLVIKGLSRGQSAKIVSNTATSYTLEAPILLDTTSVWVVVTASWEYTQDTLVSNADPNAVTTVALNVSNYAQLPVVIEGITVDTTGTEIAEPGAPVCMLWVYGAQGTRDVTADTTQLVTDGRVRFDSAGGPITYQCIAGALVPNQRLIVEKISADMNVITVLPYGAETFDDQLSIRLVAQGDKKEIKFNG